MNHLSSACKAAGLALALAATAVWAQNYTVSWYTIDGGGSTSAAGTFQLGGTIGQPDAGSFSTPMTGGGFTLVGGFWPVAAGGVCTLPGDMNLDGLRDGQDVQLFVNCILNVNGSNCGCADFDGGGAGASDVPQFVAALLAG